MAMWRRKSISRAGAVPVSASSRMTSMNPYSTSPSMARKRSARKQDVPLRSPRRNTGPFPASARSSLPSASMRLAIFLALIDFLIFFLKPYLVAIARAGSHFESLRHVDARNPDDLTHPFDQGNPIPDHGGDFTINQHVLQLFLVWQAEGLKAVAGTPASNDEGRFGALG